MKYTYGFNDDPNHNEGPPWSPGPLWTHEDAITDAQRRVREEGGPDNMGDQNAWIGDPEIGGPAFTDETEGRPETETWGFTVILRTED